MRELQEENAELREQLMADCDDLGRQSKDLAAVKAELESMRTSSQQLYAEATEASTRLERASQELARLQRENRDLEVGCDWEGVRRRRRLSGERGGELIQPHFQGKLAEARAQLEGKQTEAQVLLETELEEAQSRLEQSLRLLVAKDTAIDELQECVRLALQHLDALQTAHQESVQRVAKDLEQTKRVCVGGGVVYNLSAAGSRRVGSMFLFPSPLHSAGAAPVARGGGGGVSRHAAFGIGLCG